MKAVRIGSSYTFYIRVLLTFLLIAGLAFLQTPYGVANQGKHDPEQASLSVVKTVDSVKANPRVTFGIEKSVDKSAVTLDRGESSEVTYTINVTRSEAEETSYTVSGKIIATNGPENKNPAKVTLVEDAVEYKEKEEKGRPDWIEQRRVTVLERAPGNEDLIYPGESKTYVYTITFTAPTGADKWKNWAYVTISNRGGNNADEPYKYKEDFRLPQPEDDTSTEVRVTDSESLTPSDAGVSYKVKSVAVNGTPSSDLVGPWSVTPPVTITITKTISASATATPGTYKLENTASIVDGPSDPAEVTITIPSGTGGTGGGGDTGGGTGGGGTGGGGAAQESAPSGQGGPLVTTGQPAPSSAPPAAVSPTQVAQAATPRLMMSAAKPSAAPLPKKLPYTGLNLWWYGLISISLIAVGSLLQLDSISK